MKPPIDILGLVKEYADVIEVDWPEELVDGLTYDLNSPRPRVFLRSNARRRRKRFTLAHELGHILMAWHAGTIECATDFDIELRADNFGREEEAELFAACLLVPDSWLGEILVRCGDDMSSVLAELSEADVSIEAAMRSLRRNLFSGWAFEYEGYYGPKRTMSPGTEVPPDLGHAALATGTTMVSGRPVSWYRFIDEATSPSMEDFTEGPNLLLQKVLEDATDDPESRAWLRQSLNGMIGGVLREGSRGKSVHEIFRVLQYRIGSAPYGHLLAHPEFRAWLFFKADDIVEGRTKRRKGRIR